MKLTKQELPAAIAGAKAKGKPDVIVFDDDLQGFGLRLQGKRQSWIIQYRIRFKQRRLKIGDAAKMSPDDAR